MYFRRQTDWGMNVDLEVSYTYMVVKVTEVTSDGSSKIKNTTTIWSSNPSSKFTSKRNESKVSKRHLHTIIYSSIIHSSQRWKQPIHCLKTGWINKMWYTHTVKYYSALKRKEILLHAAKRINLEDMMLNETSQSQKENYCMIPLIWGI